MIVENKIYDGVSEQEIINRSRLTNFKNLGKKYFQACSHDAFTPINYIKENLQFYKLHLPHPINENLIRYDFAPVYWVSSSPLMLKLESYLKETAPKEYVLDYFNYIKEFYFKWVIVDTPADKKYFAASMLNALKRSDSDTLILNTILHAMVLIFEKSIFNAEAAQSKLNAAVELIGSLNVDDNVKTELQYLLNIYYGFSYLKKGDVESAVSKFSEALTIKPDGINAVFYIALSYTRLQNYESANNFIRRVYEYDQRRISFAIEKSDFAMFRLFANKPVIAYFFEFKEMLEFVDLFKSIKDRNENLATVRLNPLRLKISMLKEIRVSDYYNDEMLSCLNFLDKFVQAYLGTENTIILGAAESLNEKFSSLILMLQEAIDKQANDEVAEKLTLYDKNIEESETQTERLRKELDQLKEKIKTRLEEDLERVSQIIASTISSIENEIQNTDTSHNFNPTNTFNSSMTYALIISIIVFMIGGLAGYLNSSEVNVWEFNSVMSIVLSAGIKWSAVSIFIGILISFILSASTMLERSSRKQKLMEEIGAIKKSEDREKEKMKMLAEDRIKSLEERYMQRIKHYESRMTELSEQKNFEKEMMKKTILQNYQKLIDQLNALLS